MICASTGWRNSPPPRGNIWPEQQLYWGWRNFSEPRQQLYSWDIFWLGSITRRQRYR